MLTWMAVFGLALNLHLPKFDWISETVVIKQSASVMIVLFAGMGFIATPALLYGLWLHAYLGMTAFLWIMTALFALLAYLGWRYLLTRGVKVLERIAE